MMSHDETSAARRRAAFEEAMRELYGDAVIRAYGHYRIPGTAPRDASQARRPRRRAGGMRAPGSSDAIIAECRAAYAALAEVMGR